MKKKYYFILLGIILVTGALYILLGKGGMDPKVIVDAYEKEWGIVIPSPTTEKSIFASEATDDSHGQWFTIYSYDETQDFSKSKMKKLTAKEVVAYQKRVTKFEQDTFNSYSSKGQKKIEASFKEHRLQVKEGDYVYYKEKENGENYFLAIYNGKELFTYNWYS